MENLKRMNFSSPSPQGEKGRMSELLVRSKGVGITLIEILVAIVIISLLASAATPMYRKARVRALVAKTEVLISSIDAALSMYQSDIGDYPEFDEQGCSILVERLQGPVDNKYWKGPYMRFKSKDLDKDNNLLDAWKTPFFYTYPQSDNLKVPYTLTSAGPDRKFGTDDDIGNW